GTAKWTAPLVDGRRLVTGQRVAVLDGTDRLLVFAPADGTAEELGVGGTINDVTMSRDGRVVGAIVHSRRAVLFTLPCANPSASAPWSRSSYLLFRVRSTVLAPRSPHRSRIRTRMHPRPCAASSSI